MNIENVNWTYVPRSLNCPISAGGASAEVPIFNVRGSNKIDKFYSGDHMHPNPLAKMSFTISHPFDKRITLNRLFFSPKVLHPWTGATSPRPFRPLRWYEDIEAGLGPDHTTVSITHKILESVRNEPTFIQTIKS